MMSEITGDGVELSELGEAEHVSLADKMLVETAGNSRYTTVATLRAGMEPGWAGVFTSVATLLSSSQKAYIEGDLLHAATEGVTYKVVAPSVAQHDIVTGGGVKLYVLPNGRGEYDLRAFGFVSNTEIGQSGLLQKAFNAASRDGGGIVLHPGGVLKCSGVVGRAGVGIRGIGPSSILRWNQSGWGYLVRWLDGEAHDIVVENLAIDVNTRPSDPDDNDTGSGDDFVTGMRVDSNNEEDGYSVIMRNTYCFNSGKATAGAWTLAGLQTTGCRDVLIENNGMDGTQIKAAGFGRGQDNIRILNNTSRDARKMAIAVVVSGADHLHTVEVAGNFIHNPSSHAIFVGGDGSHADDSLRVTAVNIHDNIIDVDDSVAHRRVGSTDEQIGNQYGIRVDTGKAIYDGDADLTQAEARRGNNSVRRNKITVRNLAAEIPAVKLTVWDGDYFDFSGNNIVTFGSASAYALQIDGATRAWVRMSDNYIEGSRGVSLTNVRVKVHQLVMDGRDEFQCNLFIDAGTEQFVRLSDVTFCRSTLKDNSFDGLIHINHAGDDVLDLRLYDVESRDQQGGSASACLYDLTGSGTIDIYEVDVRTEGGRFRRTEGLARFDRDRRQLTFNTISDIDAFSGDLSTGALILARRENAVYEVASSGESSHDLTTAGGEKLFQRVPAAAATANRPSGIVPKGYQVFDVDLGQPIWYDGKGWVDAAGDPI